MPSAQKPRAIDSIRREPLNPAKTINGVSITKKSLKRPRHLESKCLGTGHWWPKIAPTILKDSINLDPLDEG